MHTHHLVDPELIPALEGAPQFGDMTGTLSEIRGALAGGSIPAPAAPGTTVQERTIPGADGTTVRVLVYVPAEQAPHAGCLLWFHGGGMIMGAPEQNDPLCRYLAQTTGAVVVAVAYGLAPERPYPGGLEDSYTALRWSHAVADELGYPRHRIAVAGESGGGGMAAALTQLARDRGELAISAQFLLYPMLDDRTGTPVEPDPAPHTGEFVWTRESNRFAWRSVLGAEPGADSVPAYAAPGRSSDLSGLPPLSLIVGDLDLFVGENVRYAQALARDGVSTMLHVYPGAYHAFISFAQDAGVSRRGFREFVGAIERHFHPLPVL